jgi:hypothetical protein
LVSPAALVVQSSCSEFSLRVQLLPAGALALGYFFVSFPCAAIQ